MTLLDQLLPHLLDGGYSKLTDGAHLSRRSNGVRREHQAVAIAIHAQSGHAERDETLLEGDSLHAVCDAGRKRGRVGGLDLDGPEQAAAAHVDDKAAEVVLGVQVPFTRW